MSIDYRQLRARMRIQDVLSWMSWQATGRMGDQLRGRCPFCTTPVAASSSATDSSLGAKERTFSVHTQRHIYRCFRCHSSGNALDLWSTYRRIPIYQAAQEIQTRLGENQQP